MQVRVLGCSGAIARDCRTTSFLIDGRILIDAGTGVGDLTLDEMQAVDDVFLTHSHLDHIAALPMMLGAVASRRAEPLRLHALPETIAALRQHIFNDVIWPDFSRIPSQKEPFMRYLPLQVGQSLSVAGTALEVLPARHTVPAVGYAIQGHAGWWVFSGDTERNPAFWARVNALPVAMLIMETAFSERESALARRSLHLSPHTLLAELQAWTMPHCRVYITHTKPAETQVIMQEIHSLLATGAQATPIDVRWLQAGQEFSV